MNIFKSMLAASALILASAALCSCNEDEEVAPIQIPSSDWKANTTIAELKAKYWNVTPYKLIPKFSNGDDVIIGGRVIANDISGNIYQNIMVQDSTGAICIAVDMKDLNLKYKVGEEIFINISGLYCGKYSGLFQLGAAGTDKSGNPQISKMSEADFLAHTQLNGLPEPSKIETFTMTIDQINSLLASEDSVKKYQSQLVRLNGVSFLGGGQQLWASRGTAHNTRYLFDQQGSAIAVDNSGMSDFNDKVLPAGHGDVIAILSYFSSKWQLVFRTNEDCLDFGGESYAPAVPEAAGDGSMENPFNVSAVIDGAAGSDVWITGYIVGWIDGISMSADSKFTVPASSNSNLLLAPSPDVRFTGLCIPVQLSAPVRNALNLKDNAGNLGKQVSIRGSLEKYFGANGMKSTVFYNWGPTGAEGGDTPEQPTGVKFRKVTSLTSGKQYLIVASGKVATLNTANYGYLKVVDGNDVDGVIEASEANAFTFTSTTGGWNIKMSDGRFLYQTGTYNSFNFSATSVDGDVWTVEPQADGTFKITNNAVNKFIQFDSQYTSYGSYSDSRGTLPYLYEKVN